LREIHKVKLAFPGCRVIQEGAEVNTPKAMSEEYLTIAEVAARLKVKPKTVKNKMASGIFRKGVHYFSPQGLGPRFKWSAVVEWLEKRPKPITEIDDSIPMARGYRLGKSNRGVDTGR
jgi:hypothetical protein